MNDSLREYVEQRAHQLPVLNCWLWMLSCGSHGYGQGTIPGTSVRVTTAHRISYMAFKGPIPPGMLVQHSCDNKWCVNPDHLSLGTDQTNAEDKHRKGRANLDKRVGLSRRLTPDQVEYIRASDETNDELARRFGFDVKSIRYARLGITYREPSNENS